MTRVVQKILPREDGLVSEIQLVLRSRSVGPVSAARSPFLLEGIDRRDRDIVRREFFRRLWWFTTDRRWVVANVVIIL